MEEKVEKKVEKKKVEKKMDLQSFLDTIALTRAERTYYERTYSQKDKPMTIAQWRKNVKFVH